MPTALVEREEATDSGGAVDALIRALEWRPGSALLASVVAFVLAGLVFTIFARVDHFAEARGILRVAGGVQIVCAGTSGTVATISADVGDQVEKGTVLVRLDSEPFEASLLEARRNLAIAEESRLHYEDVERPRAASAHRLLLSKNAAHSGRRPLHQRALGRAESRVSVLGSLLAKGEVSEGEYATQEERADSERERLLALDQDSQQLNIELLANEERDDLRNRETARALSTATSRLRALELEMQQTVVVAPVSGVIDAVLVRAGDRMQSGAQLLRIVPAGHPLEVVAFLPERERAAVENGRPARILFDQLPPNEYPPLTAALTRVAENIAREGDIHDVLGDNSAVLGPSFRVELSIAEGYRAGYPLRHGMLVEVRLPLRRRRLAAVLFEPLGRWLG